MAELSRLQDAAPAVPLEVVRAMVEGELGRPLEEAYASFDPHPLAAASIGQVHAAVLGKGTEMIDVVVKVRRRAMLADHRGRVRREIPRRASPDGVVKSRVIGQSNRIEHGVKEL